MPAPPPFGSFATTRWSLVARAQGLPEARAVALSELLQIYWSPLYVYLRRLGNTREDAEDLVQGFCAAFLEKDRLAKLSLDPSRGRFRSFLLTALRNYAAHERDKQHALHRGGGVPTLALDQDRVDCLDHDLRTSQNSGPSPEGRFERQWALALLDAALARLWAEQDAKGRLPLFLSLRPHLEGDPSGQAYADIARQLGFTEGAVKVAIHRLRARFRDLVREEIAATLLDPSLVDDELDALARALRT